MKNKDFSIQYDGLNGTIKFVSALTQNAVPNSDFEVHTHYQDFEIYHFLEGDLFFAFEGRRIKIEEGSIIIIPNGVLHRPIIKNSCRYMRKRILFNKDLFVRFNTADFTLYKKLIKRNILILSKEAAQKNGIDELIRDIENRLALNSPYNDFCALISLFTLLIKAEEHSEQIQNIDSYVHSEMISKILRYIDEHLSKDLNYKMISNAFFLSEKSLYKIFKNETGFALGNYINQRRIIMAQSVLNAGGSAKTAAYTAGFKDYSTFYRCFLKKVGVTPAEYSNLRKQYDNFK